MGSIFKLGNDYYIEFTARGLPYRRIGGKSRAEAERLLESIEASITKGEMGIVTPQVGFEQFFQDFLNEFIENRQSKTFFRYRSVVDHFLKYGRANLKPGALLTDITPRVIEGYRSHLLREKDTRGEPVKPKVINLTIILLKSILEHAIRLGHLNDNPAVHVRFVDHPVRYPPVLEVADVIKIKENCDGHTRPVIEAMMRTGMRPEEIIRLQWTMVDFKENCLKIGRLIPMDDGLSGILSALKNRKNKTQVFVFVDAAGEQFKEGSLMTALQKAAGCLNLTAGQLVFVLRNTFARNIVLKGVSLVGLYRLLGSTDIAHVMRYKVFVNN